MWKALALFLPAILFGWFWNVPPSPQKRVDFPCPYHCGEWGSESIDALEWDFIGCLYQADEWEYYIEKNWEKREKELSSVPGFAQRHYALQYSEDLQKKYHQFVPIEVTFPYRGPRDPEWYRILKQPWEVIFSEGYPGWNRGCASHHIYWVVQESNGKGRTFVRTLYDESTEHRYILESWGLEDVYLFEGEIDYTFGNYIDFHNACNALEEDLWMIRNAYYCREYGLSPLFEAEVHTYYLKTLEPLKEVRKNYREIFAACAKKHQAPSAFYHLALCELADGKYEKGLEHFKAFFDKVNLDAIEPNLASQAYQSKGATEVEVALYDEAIASLGKALESNPKHKEAYFERAIAYFEKGEFDRSLKDYLDGGQDVSLYPPSAEWYLLEYEIGLLSGAAHGIKDAITEFLPSVCSSLSGVGNLLWTTVSHPIEAPKQFATATLAFCDSLRNCDKAELAKILVPELYELFDKWDTLSEQRRGELVGYTIGKYGTDILLPVAVVKGGRCVKAYSEVKKAEKLCTLKTLGESAESQKALTQAAAKWGEQRKAWFKQVRLDVDKQNKHIRGKHNFEKGKSEWTHPDPERKLKEFAGKGQKIVGEPGQAGYRERVDCREVIGYFVNDETKEKLPTTMATIRYSKKGAHIVPATPKK